MVLVRLLTREQSTDKVTQKNGRWEINDDGINTYIHDETITVSADKRCLGCRSKSAWGYSRGSAQCSAKGSPKWSNGELCKKCSDDVFANWQGTRQSLLVQVVRAGYEDDFQEIVSQAFTDEGIDQEKYPNLRNCHSAYTRAWVDFGMEALYTKHGLIEPEADSVAVRNQQRAKAREQENLLRYNMENEMAIIDLSDQKRLLSELAVMQIGEQHLPIVFDDLLSGGYYRRDADMIHYNYHQYVKSIDAEGVVHFDEEERDRDHEEGYYVPPSDNVKEQIQQGLDQWRAERKLHSLSRVTIQDIKTQYTTLSAYIAHAENYNRATESLQALASGVTDEVCSRLWPWQQEEEE